MPYTPDNLKTEAFIAGRTGLYNVVCENPQLRMIPITQLDGVRHGLQQLGYRIRIRYRGPHRPQHDTLKQNARAFTVYFDRDC
ncbi:hypothetical protein UFOVP328_422 [uncultured Caudovirales phage]|uniref:Uncharacterized protein n=1 Tax=uncultured Caudovirales phage TaxID=2100421 RepID=A0A6J5M2T5_9CAUD|nr:hypothetical protein UFOVP328_422 [uncultured Caudovirales phage]